MSDDDRLVIHGAPESQPARAVVWTCLMKGLPFELRRPDWGNVADSEVGRLNPKHQVPTIVDGDFSLYEMPAILIYLCEKHGWQDLHPSDLETRARVNQYLHFHHTSSRLCTMKLMAPHVTRAFRELIGDRGEGMDVMQSDALRAAIADPDGLATGRRIVGKVAGMIEASYLQGADAFLCGRSATIADVACYEELAQLRWAGLFDFVGFPKLRDWLEEMARLPCHEQAHRYNLALGDILSEPNTLPRFLAATAAGQAALEELGARVVSPG